MDRLTNEADKLKKEGRPRTLSNARDLGFIKLTDVTAEVIKETNKWVTLVQKADAARVANRGLTFPNNKARIDAWEKADRAEVEDRKEHRKMEKEEERITRISEAWNANTDRWEVRNRAIQLFFDLKDAERKVVLLAQDPEYYDDVWQNGYNKANQKLEQLEKNHNTFRAKWLEMADGEKSVRIAREEGKDEGAIDIIKEKLKKSDQVVIELWNELMRRRQEQGSYEVSKPQTELASYQGEANNYKLDLLNLKESDLKACIEKAKKLTNQQGDEFQFATYAVAEYAELAEQKALEDAKEKIPGAEAAWELRVTEAENAAKEAEQQIIQIQDGTPRDAQTERNRTTVTASSTSNQRRNSNSTNSDGKTADNKNQDSSTNEYLEREILNNMYVQFLAEIAARTNNASLTATQRLSMTQTTREEAIEADSMQTFEILQAVAAADRKAFDAFQRETERLDDIEKTWIAQLEEEERIATMKRERAAKIYIEGDSTAWMMLTPEERKIYNDGITALNNAREEEIQKKLEETLEKAEELHEEAKRVNDSWIASNSSKKAAEEAAQQAEDELATLEIEEAGRKEAIRWGGLTSVEREKERAIGQWRTSVEQAFAHARETKGKLGEASKEKEEAWNKAKVVAMNASAHWDSVIEEIKSGKNPLGVNLEEAMHQKDYLLEKAGVAELKALGAKPCGDGLNAKHDRADEMITLIRNKIWPTVSQAMKNFITHPNEATMLAVYESSFVSTSAYTFVSASISAFAANSYVPVSDPRYVYDYGSISASTYAYVYASASAYISASASAAASISAHAYISPYANYYASAAYYTSAYTTTAIAASAASVAASAASAASATSTASIASAASIVSDVADKTKVFGKSSQSIIFNESKQSIQGKFDWLLSVTEETAAFIRTVAKYKTEQKATSAAFDGRGEIEDESQGFAAIAREAFITAKELRNEDVWKKAEAAARKAVSYFKDIKDGNNSKKMSYKEAIEKKEYWTERAKLAEIKVLAYSPCDNNWSKTTERANELMRMTRKNFGSPISNAMKEFMKHPNEAMLRATGKSFVIAMTATEAEEALETAKIFAKASADVAIKGRVYGVDTALQKNVDWSESITREITEFARAVATFKAKRETAVAVAAGTIQATRKM